jgi:tetratricopeptide (TPR) repeat protein
VLPAEAVLDTLARLVDKSLVVVEEAAQGQARYRYLETLREYAGERLAASGAAEAYRDRHLRHFSDFAEAAAPELEGSAQRAWLDRLESDHDNFRAALRWALDRPIATRAERAVGIAGAIAWFWIARGHLHEAHAWLDAVLTLSAAHRPTAARARALGWASLVSGILGDRTAEQARREQCIAMVRQGDDPHAVTWALRSLGLMARRVKNPADAAALLVEGLAHFQQTGDQEGIAWTLLTLGTRAREAGDYDLARQHQEECLAIFRRLGNRDRAAAALHNLGMTTRAAGDAAASRPFHEEALAIWRDLGYENGVAGALNGLGEVALELDDVAGANVLFAEALERFRSVGNRSAEALVLCNLARLAWLAGDPPSVRARLAEAFATWGDMDGHRQVAGVLETFASLSAAHGQEAPALHLAGAATAARDAAGAPLSDRRRAALEANLAPARAALGAAAPAAFERGGAMSLDEAIDEVVAAAPPTGHSAIVPAPGAPTPAGPAAATGAVTEDGEPDGATAAVRDTPAAGATLPAAALRVDVPGHAVWRGAEPVAPGLSVKEFALVAHLAAHADRVCTREELGDAVWGPDRWDPNMLHRLVRRVKEKLEPDPARPRYLRTVPGVGYRLVA